MFFNDDDNFDAKSDRNITFEEDDIAESKGYCIAGYFLFFIPYLHSRKTKSQFATFHANQSLLVFFAVIFTGLVGLIPVVGFLLMILSAIFVWLPMFYVGIGGAVAGEARRVPYIGFLNLINYL